MISKNSASLLKFIFRKLGYNINKIGYSAIPDSSMNAGLKRAKEIHISPSRIIDIGAAEGTWTEKALLYWPKAKYDLIEPLVERSERLEQLKKLHPNLNYFIAAAGESAGETGFNVSSDLDGSGIYDSNDKGSRRVPVIAIDEITSEDDKNIIIKLDTHGYEKPIFYGAINTLKRTALIIVEVYGFHVSPTCLLFHELSAELDKLGFRLVDMVDIMRRPGDQAFWQCDAFYIKKDNPVFSNSSYV